MCCEQRLFIALVSSIRMNIRPGATTIRQNPDPRPDHTRTQLSFRERVLCGNAGARWVLVPNWVYALSQLDLLELSSESN